MPSMTEHEDQRPPAQVPSTEPQVSTQPTVATEQVEHTEAPPPSYASHDHEDPPTHRETAVEGLDGLLAIGPFSGDAVRTMAGVKEFGIKSSSVDGLLTRVKCDLEMLRNTVNAEEARVKELGKDEQQRELTGVQSLIEGVDIIQKRYIDLSWETRLLATKVEAHLLDFVNTVLPCVVDYQADEDERHADLRGFINMRKPPFASTESDDPYRAFLKFEQDLKATLNKAITYAISYHEKLHNRNEVWKADKERLDKKSKDCQDILTKTPQRVGLTLGATAVGAVSSLPIPAVSATIAAAGLGVAVADTIKIVTNIGKIFEVNKEQKSFVDLHDLDQAVDRTSGIKSRLLDEPSRVPNLSQLSNVILKLWDMAAEDAEFLDGHDLDDIVHDEDLLLKIENISITYKAYANTLKEFTNSLQRTGIFIGRRST